MNTARALLLACLCTGLVTAHAGEVQESDKELPFKLTVGEHHFSQSGRGLDVNLRHTSNLGTTWLGYFKAGDLDAHQSRAGWEHWFGDSLRVLPSLQVASGGFVGGSVNIETGERWIAGAGLGRTNLHPYFNLNFDPNDAWTLSGAYRSEGGAISTLFLVHDNRLNPDQRHLHAVHRTPLANGNRLTIDLLFKQGLVGGVMTRRTGATITYDWPRFFVRLAYDPVTNFTPDYSTRLSVGTRF